ncbi:hypothetical protein HDU91_002016, partial [Kappamyces sp. JEL0680]
MPFRLQDILDLVIKHGISETDDIQFASTNTRSIAIARVLRDGKMRLLPCNLLAQGDIVMLGERAPAKMRHRDHANPVERDQILKPDFFGSRPFDSVPKDTRFKELFKFRVMETPVKEIIESAVRFKRPSTITSQYIKIVETVFDKGLVWILLLLSLGLNLGRVFLDPPSERGPLWYTMLARLQVLAILPILPISFPTIMLLSRSYANAYILTLFEALQSSKTEFEDKDDVDEFDAAPAPTKELVLSWSAIFRKSLDQVIKLDGTHLIRMTGLIESLSNTTVLCSVDREGTVASPLPAVDQLLFLNQNGEPVVLDLNYDVEAPHGVRFEDNDWSMHLKLLKPFGLSSLLSTECGVVQGRKRNDLHFKGGTKIHSHLCPSTARQTCLCHIGREIGFNAESFSTMGSVLTIETLAPLRELAVKSMEDYHYEIPGFTSQIVAEISNGSAQSYQVFSEGSL